MLTPVKTAILVLVSNAWHDNENLKENEILNV